MPVPVTFPEVFGWISIAFSIFILFSMKKEQPTTLNISTHGRLILSELIIWLHSTKNMPLPCHVPRKREPMYVIKL